MLHLLISQVPSGEHIRLPEVFYHGFVISISQYLSYESGRVRVIGAEAKCYPLLLSHQGRGSVDF